ncbi:MAG: hypothetical protein M5U34_16030 [Chloroflexi bacterium]|nr:hypothetical protein [Chloroflexota bacterium]
MVYSTSWCPDCHRTKFFFDEKWDRLYRN